MPPTLDALQAVLVFAKALARLDVLDAQALALMDAEAGVAVLAIPFALIIVTHIVRILAIMLAVLVARTIVQVDAKAAVRLDAKDFVLAVRQYLQHNL